MKICCLANGFEDFGERYYFIVLDEPTDLGDFSGDGRDVILGEALVGVVGD